MLKSLNQLRFGVVGLLLVSAAALWPAPDEASFSKTVAPILTRNCITCHSGTQPQSRLDLTTRDRALKGGQRGPALVPGDPTNSQIYRRITGSLQPAMPLGGKLSSAEIDVLKSWIEGGATWD